MDTSVYAVHFQPKLSYWLIKPHDISPPVDRLLNRTANHNISIPICQNNTANLTAEKVL